MSEVKNQITPDLLAKAIRVKIPAMSFENAKGLSMHIMNFFGYSEKIVDNNLDTSDRNLFYLIEDEGFLFPETEDIMLFDGREWRIFYWNLKSDTILNFAKRYDKMFERREGKAREEAELFQTLYDEEHLYPSSFPSLLAEKTISKRKKTQTAVEVDITFDEYLCKKRKEFSLEQERLDHIEQQKRKERLQAMTFFQRLEIPPDQQIIELSNKFNWKSGFYSFVNYLESEKGISRKEIKRCIENNNNVVPHQTITRFLEEYLEWNLNTYFAVTDPAELNEAKRVELRASAITCVCNILYVNPNYIHDALLNSKDKFDNPENILNKFWNSKKIDFVISDEEIARQNKKEEIQTKYGGFLNLSFDQLGFDSEIISTHKEDLETMLQENLCVGKDNLNGASFIFSKTLDKLSESLGLAALANLLPKIFTQDAINKLLCESMLGALNNKSHSDYFGFWLFENQMQNGKTNFYILGKDEWNRNICKYKFNISPKGYFSVSEIELRETLAKYPEAIANIQARLQIAEENLIPLNKELVVCSELLSEFSDEKNRLLEKYDRGLLDRVQEISQENHKTLRELEKTRTESRKIYSQISQTQFELIELGKNLFGLTIDSTLPSVSKVLPKTEKESVISVSYKDKALLSKLASLNQKLNDFLWPVSVNMKNDLCELTKTIDSLVFTKKDSNQEKQIKSELEETSNYYSNLFEKQKTIVKTRDELIIKYESEEKDLNNVFNVIEQISKVNKLTQDNKNLKARLENEVRKKIAWLEALNKLNKLLVSVKEIAEAKKQKEVDGSD